MFRISTIYGELATSQINVMSIEEMQDICLDLMPDLYQLFDIENEYILTDTYDFDEDYLFFTFEKMLENGITNPFQSINVVFNKDSLNFSIAAKFDSAPNAIDPQISESEAIAVANEHAVNENLFNSAKLTYISDRLYNLKIDHYNDNICYLVYEVSSSNNDDIFYIDALSGEYVGRDLIMGETGFAIAIQESADSSADNYNSELKKYTALEIIIFNSWFLKKMNWAASAMKRPGYTTTSDNYTTTKMFTAIRNYLKALNTEYAFYFTGHGNMEVLGFHGGKNWIYPSDITGNWHFVFLDACKTAEGSGWADAFKFNGYSNRAFLGWSNSVTYDATYNFSEGFWPRVDGKNAIRQAAVDAAALVPGSGTTPIKFYGDISYTGKAWS